MKKLFIIIILLILIIPLFIPHNKEIKPYTINNSKILESNINKGYTIKDKNNNEWVWIKVPKSIYKNTHNSNDYKNIEKDIKIYTKDYSNSKYKDIKYTTLKNKVLKSVYLYGGFYVSRYEIGTTSIRTNRNITDTPYSKIDMYPYNHVRFNDAYNISNKLSNNSNLLFGFQWDLICKFIKENTNLKLSDINNNSSSWGNYASSNFTLTRGKYSKDYGINYLDSNNTTKEFNDPFLTTTGASTHNKKLNLYDFAGNLAEWTLEVDLDNPNNHVIRDGSFYFNYGGNFPVSGRYSLEDNIEDANYGFRVALYK